jgi:hypothetical protein
MVRTRSWGCAAVLLLCACGGSGGGGGGDPVFLTGDFQGAFARAFVDILTGPHMVTLTGDGMADGSGLLGFGGTLNDNGTVSVSAPPPIQTALGADGSLALLDGADVVARGWLGESGNLALLGSVDPGGDPAIFALLREWPGTATNGDLAGSYHSGVLLHSSGTTASAVSAATANGAGTLTLMPGGIFNSNGSIGATGPSTVTYSVAPDGTTSLTEGTITYEGGLLLPDGSMLVATGGTTSGNPPVLFTLVQAASSASLATFTGTYRVVGLAYDFATPAWRSVTGTMVADGLGNVTVTWTTNEEGTITNESPVTVAYTVAPSGSLQVTTPGGTLQGAVSQDGNRGFLGGGTNAGSDPAIYVFMRQ